MMQEREISHWNQLEAFEKGKRGSRAASRLAIAR